MLNVSPTSSASVVRMDSSGASEPPGLGDDEDIVLREAHHRMKNTLALLVASLRLDFKSVVVTDLREAVDRFERRIVAFGELYHLLSVGSGRGEISVREYFECLCRALTTSILEPKGLRCEVSIEDGLLAENRCERLGLIIAELVTNAAKHAFANQEISREKGRVRVEALYRDDSWYCGVSDNGVGAADRFRGCGRVILEGLTRSIGARMIAESGSYGTTITVVLPNSI
jgi:two-component sensor histidine kinase